MARRISTTRVCDYCGAETDVVDYRMKIGSGAAREILRFDACKHCEVFVGLPEWEKVGSISRGGRLVRRVVDPSEIDAEAERMTGPG